MTSWDGLLLFGHRGAPAEGLPENTREAFTRALESGAHALETDVHLTRDGVVVISHDDTLARVFGVPLAIRDHSLAEVQAAAPVPTLADVLALYPATRFNIDIKARRPAMETAVVATVRQSKAEARVLLTSFHADVVKRVRATGYAGPTGLCRNELARLLLLPASMLRAWPLRGARAQVPRRSGPFRFDTPAFIDKAHALGVAVDFWTVNDVEEARALLDIGADGIMSDHPGAVRAAFHGRQPRG